MAIVVSIQAGKIFQLKEKITTAKLNQLGIPTISLTGTIGPADMAPGDYSAQLTAGPYFYGLDTGAANAAAVTLTPAPAALVDGLLVAFKVGTANTGAATLNVCGLGAAVVKKQFNLDLEAGDWQPGAIVACRYQLDANLVPTGSVYSGGGALVVPVIAGRTYTWTKSTNDINCVVDGLTTLTASTSFVATQGTVTLNGTAASVVTASLVPQSNVWQQLSLLANPPRRYYRFRGATQYRRGQEGLLPAPGPGQQNLYLRMDGTFQDVVAQATAAANAPGAALQIFNHQNFL